MEFLVELEIEIPVGTPRAEVDQHYRAESAAAARLAEDGHLVRLWRRPLVGDGTTAVGLYRADNQTELDFFLRYTTADSMVQAVCLGEEFSIDVFCDLDGHCLAAVPRTMIESKGGESIKGMTIKDADLIAFGVRVSEALRIIGPANVQCFREPDGELQVTDVNPRFGGGFPLPTAAGSRYPELALALAAGEQLEPRLGDFRAGVVMTRFFSEVILEERDGSLHAVQATSVQAEAVPREA